MHSLQALLELRRLPLRKLAFLVCAATAVLGMSRVARADLDCPIPATNALGNPAFDTGAFAPWMTTTWSFGGPNMTPPGSVFFGGTTPAPNSLSQTLAVPALAACVRYHVTLEDFGLAGMAEWRTTIEYTVGPPDVSTFLHPGGAEAGHPANYRSVDPLFDPTRLITKITVEQVGAFNGSPTCLDNFMICPDACPPPNPICGDGTVDPGEECDDGNLFNGDGCDMFCQLEGCGNGMLDPGEQCDDGNTTSGDGCSSTCQNEGCGNGMVDPGEECDDGNTVNGDGCSSTCQTEAGDDHYKCYKTRTDPFPRRNVTLVDQFLTTSAEVVRPLRFCNPADKNGEGINDPTAHLMCYQIREAPFTRRSVLVRNQFGDQTLTVVKPESLCNPAEKDGVPSPLDINHFKCYRVSGPGFTTRLVTVADQFETQPATLVKPRLLCNPVSKNGEPIVDPEGHLACYTIKRGGAFTPRPVTVMDQFAVQDLRALQGTCRKRSVLCVPSEKNPTSPSGAFLDPTDSLL